MTFKVIFVFNEDIFVQQFLFRLKDNHIITAIVVNIE